MTHRTTTDLDVAWLIEKKQLSRKAGPEYWSAVDHDADQNVYGWDADVNHAMRFGDQTAAQAYIDVFAFEDAEAIEHAWVATPAVTSPVRSTKEISECVADLKARALAAERALEEATAQAFRAGAAAEREACIQAIRHCGECDCPTLTAVAIRARAQLRATDEAVVARHEQEPASKDRT